MESNPVTGCTLDKFELTVRSRKETSTIKSRLFTDIKEKEIKIFYVYKPPHTLNT